MLKEEDEVMTRVIGRRRFLLAGIGAGGALGWGLSAWRRRESDAMQSVTGEGWALGADVSFTALHQDRETAQRAVSHAMAELERVEELMSLYRPDSQLCRLNRHGVLPDPHPHLVAILNHAKAVSQRSDGAFDVTVQPLWSLFAEARKSGRIPEPEEIVKAAEKVNWRRVEVSRREIRLHGEGTAVTLNGVAQGFAADRAVAALAAHGIQHAVVNTGEVGSMGNNGKGDPWIVGIQHPRREDAYLDLVGLDGRSLATSGDYATSFSPDHLFNHLFDPHSGRSPTAFSSVSVAASSATEADALSTAVFVLGPKKGLELVRETPTADALLVFKDGACLATGGFPSSGNTATTV